MEILMQTEDGLLMYCAKDPTSGTKESDYAAAEKLNTEKSR